MTALIITGFHRSGTSMLTRLLHGAGLFIGDRLLGGNESNLYGHFEDEDVITFHDKVLAANGFNWMFAGDPWQLAMSAAEERWIRNFVGKRNTSHKIWGFKDPRTCLFLPFWGNALDKQAIYVVVFRDFLETTQSILNRQSRDILMRQGNWRLHLKFWQNPHLALRMWIAYNKALLNFIEECSEVVVCVRHRQLLDGFSIFEALRRAGLELDRPPASGCVDKQVVTTDVGFLPGLDDATLDEAGALWTRIEQLTGGRDFDIDARVAEVKSRRWTRPDNRASASLDRDVEAQMLTYESLFNAVAARPV